MNGHIVSDISSSILFVIQLVVFLNSIQLNDLY